MFGSSQNQTDYKYKLLLNSTGFCLRHMNHCIVKRVVLFHLHARKGNYDLTSF